MPSDIPARVPLPIAMPDNAFGAALIEQAASLSAYARRLTAGHHAAVLDRARQLRGGNKPCRLDPDRDEELLSHRSSPRPLSRRPARGCARPEGIAWMVRQTTLSPNNTRTAM